MKKKLMLFSFFFVCYVGLLKNNNYYTLLLNSNSLYSYFGKLSYNLSAAVGVVPVISLKPKIVYSSGDGSMENPYVINTE